MLAEKSNNHKLSQPATLGIKKIVKFLWITSKS